MIRNKQNLKKEKGVTLVALIITIVVLIIMSAVTIFILTESGLLITASKGTENYAKVQDYEQKIMDNISKKADEIARNITDIQGGTGTNSGETEKPPESQEPELPEGWEKNKVYLYRNEDGTVIPVPNEFTVSSIPEERKANKGLVIYQIPEEDKNSIDWTADVDGNGYLDVQENYNQFVWVPVINPDEMFGVDKDKNILGKLYNFTTSGVTPLNWTEENGIMNWLDSSEYREPDYLTSTEYGDASIQNGINYLKDIVGITGNSNEEILEKWKTQLQNEFKEMKTSVEKYKGFYIGRYETGNLSATIGTVSKNNINIANQNWYLQYQKSKTIAQESNFKSSMIWGCQWDATLKWFLSNEETKEYVTNSDKKGNYKGMNGNKAIPTGSNEEYKVNNIYDMAGNLWEWTIEAVTTYCHTIRRRTLQSLWK